VNQLANLLAKVPLSSLDCPSRNTCPAAFASLPVPLHLLHLLLAGGAYNQVGTGIPDTFEELGDNPLERLTG
jgi:hypothetical protein